LLIRNWPIRAVSAVAINTIAVLQSTAPNVQGWVVDASGRFLALRGGNAVSAGGLLMNTFGNLYRMRGGGGFAGWGIGFTEGIQNIAVSYTAGFSATPFDLELAARRTAG